MNDEQKNNKEYQCPNCEADKPEYREPCPECDYEDKTLYKSSKLINIPFLVERKIYKN